MGVFKKLFDELENHCAELDKRIQMELAADSDQNDERILALRAAHQHSSQAQQLYEKEKFFTGIIEFTEFAF